MSQWHSVIWTSWDEQSSESTGWWDDPSEALKVAANTIQPAFDKRLWIGWIAHVTSQLDEDIAEEYAGYLEDEYTKRLLRLRYQPAVRATQAFSWKTHKSNEMVCCWSFILIRRAA